MIVFAASTLVTNLAILVLAGFVGYAVISKVPNTLHTPLMSGTNAIHGIVLLGGLLVIGDATGVLNKTLLVIAIAFGTINIVGGFLVTDRMLEMFKGRGPATAEEVPQALPSHEQSKASEIVSPAPGEAASIRGPKASENVRRAQPPAPAAIPEKDDAT